MAIVIYKPEFHAGGGVRTVGLADYKIMREGEVVKVVFSNKKRDGSWLEPHPFYMLRSKAIQYPKRTLKGVTLVMIPLHEFKQALDEYFTEEDLARAQH